MGKITFFLKKKENLFFILLGIISAANSLVFIAREVEEVAFFAVLSLSKTYFVYFVVFISYLFLLFKLFKKPIDWFNLTGKTILTLFPTMIIWHWGFSKSIHFNGLLHLAANLYLIFSGLYLVMRLKGFRTIGSFTADIWKNFFQPKEKTKNVFRIILISLVIILNLGFGGTYLSKHAAVDEPLWIEERIGRFWKNVGEYDFDRTMISDKPGITVAILSGFGLGVVDPSEHGKSAEVSEKIYLALRAPIFIFCSFSILLFYFLLSKLLPRPAAVLSCILVGLSPLLLGISTIINPDSLLWIFIPFSILSYFVYLKKNENYSLYLSGMFLGFGILTKYVANILYIFFFGLIFLEYIFNRDRYKNIPVAEYFKKSFTDYGIIVFFSLLTFFLFLPKAWVELPVLFESTIYSQAFERVSLFFIGIILFILADIFLLKSKITAFILNVLVRLQKVIPIIVFSIFLLLILSTMANVYSGMRPYDLEIILASPKTSYEISNLAGQMMAAFYSLLFGIIPIAFFSVLFLPIVFIRKRKIISDNSRWSLYFVIFILLYYIASIANNVSATVRYQIVLYPIILILSGIGLYEFSQISSIKKNLKLNYLYFIVLLASLYSLNFIRPHYFSYASDLLPKNYVLNLKDMGDGSYEAAQFLNSLPNAKKLVVWTDKRGVCAFFVGRCHGGVDFDSRGIVVDYFVVSSGRETRTTRMIIPDVLRPNDPNLVVTRLDMLYDEKNPDYELIIGGRPNNFVKVISADKSVKSDENKEVIQ